MPSVLDSPLFTIADLLREVNGHGPVKLTHRQLRTALQKRGCSFQLVHRGRLWCTPARLSAAFPELFESLLETKTMRDYRAS